MKRKPEELDPKTRKYCFGLLLNAAKDAARNDAYEDFFKGLLTHSEQIMLGRRIWISRLLFEQKSYLEIGRELRVGPNTIRRTEVWLRGLLPDYEKVLKEVEAAQLQTRQRREIKSNPFGLIALKKSTRFTSFFFQHQNYNRALSYMIVRYF